MVEQQVLDGPATRADIVSAYRLLLGREPDDAGLANYLDLARRSPLTVGSLVQHIMASREYGRRGASSGEALVEVDVDGLRVSVDANEPEFGRHIAANGGWERHIMLVLEEELRPGQVYVDVGANVGIMAFTAARVVGPTGRVIAFEPNNVNARYFLRSVVRNGLGEVVRLHRIGLSDRAGVLTLEGGSNTAIAGVGASNRYVQVLTGDEVLAGQPKIDFIKIDIEGHEPLALAGMQTVLIRHKPRILCEFNPRCLAVQNRDVRSFANDLFKMTRAMRVIEHDGTASSVDDPDRLMDLWTSKNDHAARAGFLPDGMLHFDLLFECSLL